jgi:hypothetical protein
MTLAVFFSQSLLIIRQTMPKFVTICYHLFCVRPLVIAGSAFKQLLYLIAGLAKTTYPSILSTNKIFSLAGNTPTLAPHETLIIRGKHLVSSAKRRLLLIIG